MKGTWRLLPLVLIFVTTAAQAMTCDQKFAELCQRLRGQSGVLKTGENSSFLINPAKPAQEFLSQVRTQLQAQPTIDELLRDPRYRQILLNEYRGVSDDLSRVNIENFTRAITPLFNQLRTLALEEINNLSNNSSAKTFLLRNLQSLQLKILDRNRCHDARRPVVASMSAAEGFIALCPFTTHLVADSLVSIIAHELGHFTDPCKHLAEPAGLNLREPPFASVQSCSRRAFSEWSGSHLPWAALQPPYPRLTYDHCLEEADEPVADLIGSVITERYLRANRLQEEEADVLATEILLFRLVPYCNVQESFNYLQAPTVQNLLQCQGMSTATQITPNSHVFIRCESAFQ